MFVHLPILDQKVAGEASPIKEAGKRLFELNTIIDGCAQALHIGAAIGEGDAHMGYTPLIMGQKFTAEKQEMKA